MINDEKTSGKSYTDISQSLVKSEAEEKIGSKLVANISQKSPKKLFAEIFSLLAENNLDSVAGVKEFFKSMSEDSSLWQPSLNEWHLEKEFSLFIIKAQENFKKKYPSLVLDVKASDQQKEIKNLSDKLQTAYKNKKDPIADLKLAEFNKLKDLKKITTEDLKQILKKEGIITKLLEDENGAVIMLANEALLNPVPDVFKIFIRYVCYHAPQRFTELLSKPQYYYILHRYLSFEEISSRAKDHIQNCMFDGGIGKNILLVEFIIAFHHDFLLKDQSVPVSYPKSFFPQPPLHHGVVSVHKEVRNLFLPLVKFFEATFYNDDLFSKFLFHDEQKKQISEILQQFSDKFISEYRNSKGSTLLILALKAGCTDGAEIIVKRCPALSNITDAQQTIPLNLALEKQAPENLIALLKGKNEGKAFTSGDKKSAVEVTKDPSPEEERTTEFSF